MGNAIDERGGNETAKTTFKSYCQCLRKAWTHDKLPFGHLPYDPQPIDLQDTGALKQYAVLSQLADGC